MVSRQIVMEQTVKTKQGDHLPLNLLFITIAPKPLYQMIYVKEKLLNF